MAGKKKEDREKNPYLYLGIALLVTGGVLLGYAVHMGEAQVGIFLIFPFVLGGGIFSGLGSLFIILGFIALFIGLIQRMGFVGMEYEEEPPAMRREARGAAIVGEGRTRAKSVKGPTVLGRGRGGGVIFFGPIPVVFGSDTKVTKYMLYLAVLTVVALCFLFFYLSFSN
jgi:uncharacterized protein (TIGR00304 family)